MFWKPCSVNRQVSSCLLIAEQPDDTHFLHEVEANLEQQTKCESFKFHDQYSWAFVLNDLNVIYR